MLEVRYTLRSTYGETRAYIVDEHLREAIEKLTQKKTVNRENADGLRLLGVELVYYGDFTYEDDPIYPHGVHTKLTQRSAAPSLEAA